MKITTGIKYYKLGKFLYEHMNQIPDFESTDIEKGTQDKDDIGKMCSVLFLPGTVHWIIYKKNGKENEFYKRFDDKE